MRVKCVKPQSSFPMKIKLGSSSIYVRYKRTNLTFRRFLRSSKIKRILNILDNEVWRNVQ